MYIFYYTILLVIYCWIDEFILFGGIIDVDNKNLIENSTITIIHNFSFILFASFLCIAICKYKKNKLFNNIYVGLCYLKYISIFLWKKNNIIDHKIYSIRRSLMWIFTTIGMLDIYTKSNDIKFEDIKPILHFGSLFVHMFTYMLDKVYYKIINIVLIIPQSIFICNLNKNFLNYKYTNIIILIWIIFGVINTVSIFSFIDNNSANILYCLTDMMSKFMVMIIIYDSEEQKYKIKNLVNLQCVDINSNILQTIYKYEKDNDLSSQTKKYIEFIKKKFLSYSNFDYVSKDNLKIELLKKMLPYELEEKYLLNSIDKYEKKDNIFVLFLDIVSYSEIACKKSDENLFKILNNIYTNFDIVLRKYNYLQKIETIGDCYMIVSSLNNQTNYENEIEMYFNQLIKFSEEVINLSNNILNIKIRIGINIGSVIIGILGLDIPRLCVIGNTVNKASRLETTSESNKINISEDVYSQIKKKDLYNFELKENVYLKNIGSENTYLISIK